MTEISPETLELWRKQFEEAYFIESVASIFNHEAERYKPVDDSKFSAQVTYKTNIRYVTWINSRVKYLEWIQSRAEFKCTKAEDYQSVKKV